MPVEPLAEAIAAIVVERLRGLRFAPRATAERKEPSSAGAGSGRDQGWCSWHRVAPLPAHDGNGDGYGAD
jgi:hypothetical protein